MASARRNDRLECRITPQEKEFISRAATLSGSSTSDFVRSTLLSASREVVKTHDIIELTAAGSRAFSEALLNPPEPNENLRSLAREFGAVPAS